MFDPDFLLPDSALQRPVDFDVAAFLQRIASPLAGVKVTDGQGMVSVAALLERVATEARMDVRILLARLQMEQSLLTAEPTPDRLDWAMGYGATDSGTLEEAKGFATQVRSAAKALTGYLDPGHPFTVAGAAGQPMKVSDDIVVPMTAATAALYRYTPWVGNRPASGNQPPFGNYLFYLVWTQFFGAEPQGSSPEADWRLIVPPDNWRSPVPITATALPAFREVARRLRLVVTENPTQRKLYLGQIPADPQSTPATAPASSGGGKKLTYPSVSLLVVGERTLGSEADRYRPARRSIAAPLVAADPAVHLSAHFRLGEFLPGDASYRYARVAPALVELLERLRAELGGKPLQITSSYRPPVYNGSVGGVSNSVHLDGLAADVVCTHVPLATLFDTADHLVGDRGGVGRYWAEGFVHVDLRGERSRWP